jgi:hypothetical protein
VPPVCGLSNFCKNVSDNPEQIQQPHFTPNLLTATMTRQQQFQGKPHHPPRGGIPAYIWAPTIVVTGGVVMGYYACLDEVPLTKRKRFLATSAEFERSLGDQQYKALLQQYRGQVLPESHRASVTVHRVGSRIATVTQDFCKQHNLNHMANTPFTYTVVRSEQANAFVLPGNHIFVLSGLFRWRTTFWKYNCQLDCQSLVFCGSIWFSVGHLRSSCQSAS